MDRKRGREPMPGHTLRFNAAGKYTGCLSTKQRKKEYRLFPSSGFVKELSSTLSYVQEYYARNSLNGIITFKE